MKITNLIIFLLIILLFGCSEKDKTEEYIKTGNLVEIKNLLETGLNPHNTINGYTYIQIATSEGQLDILKEFLNHNVMQLEETIVEDLIFISVNDKHKEIYEFLLPLKNVNLDVNQKFQLIEILSKNGWNEQVANLIYKNTDVNFFYEFIEKYGDDEKFSDIMTGMFRKHIPLHEVYIGSKYDGYAENEEEGDYEYEENGEYEEEAYEEYKYGSFETLMNNISAKKKNFKLDHISYDVNKRKALLSLLSFKDNENVIFNNLYNKILSKHKYSEQSDLRGSYTSNVSIALPYFLPEFSRFNFNNWYGDDILPDLHNSNTQYFAYLFHRLDRNPKILKWMWKAWKETIFNNIDTKT